MERTGAGGSERIGVVLSAGFFGFFVHAGFPVALEELGIEYQAIADKVRVSCSYPFLFATRRIGESHYWDGGVTAKVLIEVMQAKDGPATMSESKSEARISSRMSRRRDPGPSPAAEI